MEELINSYVLLLGVKKGYRRRNPSTGEKELTRPYAAIFSALELIKANEKITPETIDEKSKKLLNFTISKRKGDGTEGGKSLAKRLEDYLNRYPSFFKWDGHALTLDQNFRNKLFEQESFLYSHNNFKKNMAGDLPTKEDCVSSIKELYNENQQGNTKPP